jgi:hypothetical protein
MDAFIVLEKLYEFRSKILIREDDYKQSAAWTIASRQGKSVYVHKLESKGGMQLKGPYVVKARVPAKEGRQGRCSLYNSCHYQLYRKININAATFPLVHAGNICQTISWTMQVALHNLLPAIYPKLNEWCGNCAIKQN